MVLAGHQKNVESLAFMADGVGLVTASSDGSVRRWNTDTLECVATFTGHHSQVYAIACSPDEKVLAACGEPAGVALCDMHTGALLRTLA